MEEKVKNKDWNSGKEKKKIGMMIMIEDESDDMVGS